MTDDLAPQSTLPQPDWPAPTEYPLYQRVARACEATYLAKDHDYGASWTEMRPTTITDQVLVKVRRSIKLETLAQAGLAPAVDESLLETWQDIVNYAIFRCVKILQAQASTHAE